MTQTTAIPTMPDRTPAVAAPRSRPKRLRRLRIARRAGGGTRRGATRLWPHWLLLVAVTFIALESILLALAMQGRWLVLLAPGVVCAGKAWETWKELKRRVVAAG